MAKFISGNWIMGLFVSYVWIEGCLEVGFDDGNRLGQESI